MCKLVFRLLYCKAVSKTGRVSKEGGLLDESKLGSSQTLYRRMKGMESQGNIKGHEGRRDKGYWQALPSQRKGASESSVTFQGTSELCKVLFMSYLLIYE